MLWLFVGMHYVQKKLIKKNQILLLNFGCFNFQQGQAPLCQLNLTKVNNRLIDLDRVAKVLLGFLEEKLKALIYIHFSLLWKFSDHIQNCTIQFKKVKDWTLTFLTIAQNFKSCLKSTVMIEANSWKNRRKLRQQSQRNCVV